MVKKYGGSITLTEEEMQSVSTGDLIGMYFEPKTGNLILKEIESKDTLEAAMIVRNKKITDKVYDN